MNIAIISDERMPTAWDFPGHGLGKHCLGFADGLAERGHNVTLFAAPKSKFHNGKLVIYNSPKELIKDHEIYFTEQRFDVILDSSHLHRLWRVTQIPVVNYSPDRENAPGPNAVFPSMAHRRYHDKRGWVVPNYVDTDEFAFNDSPDDYYLFLATPHHQKGIRTAYYIAHKQGIDLVVAGPQTEMYPGGIGPVAGRDKLQLLQGAKALLFPSPHEAGPFTVLEAQSCGTPVLCYNKGGAADYVVDGMTGFCAESQEELAWCVNGIDTIERSACREHILKHHTKEVTISLLENVLDSRVQGETW